MTRLRLRNNTYHQCCGAGLFFWSRSRLKCTGSGLLLCDIGVLRWQSCDNSYNLSQIITICTSVADPDRYYKSPPGSGSEWRDADPDPDPGGIKI